jgi:hypothetical protein
MAAQAAQFIPRRESRIKPDSQALAADYFERAGGASPTASNSSRFSPKNRSGTTTRLDGVDCSDFDGTKSRVVYIYLRKMVMCGERHMGQDQGRLRVFLFTTVLLAAFFCSVAVALSWL